MVLSTRVDYIVVITLPANQYSSSAKGRRTFLASKWVPLTNLIQHQVRSSSSWASGGVKAVKWKTQVGDNNNKRRRSRRRQLGGNDDHSEEFLSFLEEYNIQLQYSSLYRRTSWRSTDPTAATNVSMYFFSGQSSSLVTDGDRPRFNGMSGLLHG